MNDPVINSQSLGLGHRVDRRVLAALAQLHPPHVHEHPRPGQGPGLRDHADRPAPAVASGLPAAAVLQHPVDDAVRVGRRAPRPGPRGIVGGREDTRRRPEGDRRHHRQDAPPDPEGLHRLAGAERADRGGGDLRRAAQRHRRQGRRGPARQARAGQAHRSRPAPPGEAARPGHVAGPEADERGRGPDGTATRHGRSPGRGNRRRARHVQAHRGRQRGLEHHAQRVVLRDHLLRPLPGPDVHVQPGGDRGRDARRRSTCAS